MIFDFVIWDYTIFKLMFKFPSHLFYINKSKRKTSDTIGGICCPAYREGASDAFADFSWAINERTACVSRQWSA